MTRLSKILGHFLVAVSLVAYSFLGQMGHVHSNGHISSDQSLSAEKGNGLPLSVEHAGHSPYPSEDDCHHTMEAACSFGCCFYPVAAAVRVSPLEREAFGFYDSAALSIRDVLLDPPPPRLS